MLERV
ncbi:hypothetical protein CCALI_00545 [Chthonomonas calidirosea T49]